MKLGIFRAFPAISQFYVREHKIIFEEDCPQPCLDALWWHYGECHALDSPQAKEGRKGLRDCSIPAFSVKGWAWTVSPLSPPLRSMAW